MITVIYKLLQMKHHIEKHGIEVIISCSIIRTDSKRAYTTIKDLSVSIVQSKVLYLLNTNIDESCLGNKGLHLNKRGVGRLAANLIFSDTEALAITQVQTMCSAESFMNTVTVIKE